MITLTDLEAAARLPDLLDRVAAGEEVVITRHGQSFVVKTSAEAATVADAAAVISEIRAIRDRVKPGPDWRALRDEGRRRQGSSWIAR